MKDNDSNLKAYAQYFVKFVQAYGQQNITIETIAPRTSPTSRRPTRRRSGRRRCSRSSSASTSVRRSPPRASPPRSCSARCRTAKAARIRRSSATVLANATAKRLHQGVGMQWGMMDKYDGLKGSLAASRSGRPSTSAATTRGTRQGPRPTEPRRRRTTRPTPSRAGGSSATGSRPTGVTAYSAWNMVLDTSARAIDVSRDWAQNALLTVNTSSKALNMTPAFYVFRHASAVRRARARSVVSATAAATRSRSRTRTARSSRSSTIRAARRRRSCRSPARSCSSPCRAAAGPPSFRNSRHRRFAIVAQINETSGCPGPLTALLA